MTLAEKDAEIEELKIQMVTNDAFHNQIMAEKGSLMSQIQGWQMRAKKAEDFKKENDRLVKQLNETVNQLNMQVRAPEVYFMQDLWIDY